ncbi:MAG: PAS domain S-box protein [Planctomycetota bacterium]
MENDSRRALEVAREAEARYRTLFEGSADAVYVHDFEGNLLEVNQRACEQLGYDMDELLELRVGDIEDQWGRDQLHRHLEELRQNGELLVKSVHRRQDGSRFPVEINSRLINYNGDPAVLAIVRDISARQRTDRLLEAVKAAQEAIIVTRSNGRIIFTNNAARKLLGEDVKGQNGVSVLRRIAGDKAERTTKQILRSVRENGEWEGEVRIGGSGEEAKVCYATVTAVIDENGRTQNYIATANDISAQKESQKRVKKTLSRLKETQEQLVDQERQRALNQMASGIAHDFNNALSTIRGFTELLLRDEDKRSDDDSLKHYLGVIENAANNAAETVRRMRKFYKPSEDAELHRLNVNTVIDEAISMTRPRWQQEAQAQGKCITLEKDLSPVPPVNGNEAELHEMMTNLIFNAVDAIEKEGTIIIGTGVEDERVVIEVRDTGLGMDDEVRPRCMEPFYTTKGDAGTGLGLSVTQGIVRRHGGQIEIDSEPGEGTGFRIYLPAMRGEEKEDDEPMADPDQSTGSFDVLVAEDEPTQRGLLEEMLSILTHNVDLAEDGDTALQLLREKKYDLLITDRAMPGMSGDALAQTASEIASEMPVIMVTGFGDMMEANSDKPDHVRTVLSKPVSLDTLRSAISEHMDE